MGVRQFGRRRQHDGDGTAPCLRAAQAEGWPRRPRVRRGDDCRGRRPQAAAGVAAQEGNRRTVAGDRRRRHALRQAGVAQDDRRSRLRPRHRRETGGERGQRTSGDRQRPEAGTPHDPDARRPVPHRQSEVADYVRHATRRRRQAPEDHRGRLRGAHGHRRAVGPVVPDRRPHRERESRRNALVGAPEDSL